MQISEQHTVEEAVALPERRAGMMDLAEASAVLAGLVVVLFCSGAIVSSLLSKF
ncbi:MAG: hypothetical protein ISP90_00695 [Nevskia sp.]|nr:hypothetical protein [Nevskia sp.]